MTMKYLSQRGLNYFLEELNQQRSWILRPPIQRHPQGQLRPKSLYWRLILLPVPPSHQSLVIIWVYLSALYPILAFKPMTDV
jgi:hypothetical protein